MAVGTRPRPRGLRYRPRRPGHRSWRRPAPRSRSPRPGFSPGLWLVLGAMAALIAASPWLIPLLLDATEALLTLLGLGLLLIAAALAIDAWLGLRRPLAFTRTFWRRAAALHLLLATLLGSLGWVRPQWSWRDVAFNETSLGGDFGHTLASEPIGIVVWFLATLSGLALLWPRGARLAALTSLAVARYAGESLRSFLASLLPEGQEESWETSDRPYISTWDEEYRLPPVEGPSETAALAHGETLVEEDTEALAEETQEPQPVMETSPPLPRPSVYQRPLPLGRPAGRGWELPPLDLLSEATEEKVRELDNEARAQLIVDTLKSFGVDARVISIHQGPTVTQFGIEPGWETKTRTVMERDAKGRPVYDKDGNPHYRTEVVSRTRVRVSQITSLANDLALALAAPTIRIEAPVPGKPVVGIEVPNSAPSLVTLRSVIESTAFQRLAARSRLALGLGQGVSGEPVAADLARMPHLLIAGATGSGKSVCINSIIACLLMHSTPEDLRLVLIDPKRVELAVFAEVPHLAFSHIVTDIDQVVATLQGVLQEMESRYRRFASLGVRNIEVYNRSPRAPMKLPYWVVIIDELADLMMAAPYDVERQICRLAQLARATGIHLIIATQRPSVDVVTGLIKANFPTRIAFAVSSQVDSRTIIDGAGAEKLLGRGDMLFMPTDAAKPKRLQGSYVSDQELERIVAWWRDERFRHLRPEPLDHLIQEARQQEREEEEDPLLPAAKELALEHSRVSTSLLQRRLHIGYPRAARLIDLLEREGIIGPAEGGGHSRRVLLSEDDWGRAE